MTWSVQHLGSGTMRLTQPGRDSPRQLWRPRTLPRSGNVKAAQTTRSGATLEEKSTTNSVIATLCRVKKSRRASRVFTIGFPVWSGRQRDFEMMLLGRRAQSIRLKGPPNREVECHLEISRGRRCDGGSIHWGRTWMMLSSSSTAHISENMLSGGFLGYDGASNESLPASHS
jgi:hypothetical protein